MEKNGGKWGEMGGNRGKWGEMEGKWRRMEENGQKWGIHEHIWIKIYIKFLNFGEDWGKLEK